MNNANQYISIEAHGFNFAYENVYVINFVNTITRHQFTESFVRSGILKDLYVPFGDWDAVLDMLYQAVFANMRSTVGIIVICNRRTNAEILQNFLDVIEGGVRKMKSLERAELDGYTGLECFVELVVLRV